MSDNMKLVLNSEGVRALLQSDALRDVCEEYADGILQRAGDGFKRDTRIGRYRVKVAVKTDGPAAYYKNLKDNTLAKAMR